MRAHVLLINCVINGEEFSDVEVFANEARASNRQDYLASGEESHVVSTHLYLSVHVDEEAF